MYNKKMNMIKILLLMVIGSAIIVGHTTYVKMQREKRQKMTKVLEDAKQSLAVVQSNPNQVRQIGY